jgi:hypothetical protein
MKKFIVLAGLLLAACQGSEERIAQMERADDAACKGQADYNACRARLMSYRKQEAADARMRAAQLESASEDFQRAGAALQSINPAPVTVQCIGCR